MKLPFFTLLVVYSMAQAAFAQTNLTAGDVPVNFLFSLVSTTPGKIVKPPLSNIPLPGMPPQSAPSRLLDTQIVYTLNVKTNGINYQDWVTVQSDSPFQSGSAASGIKKVRRYSNIELLSFLAHQGILPDRTAQGWAIFAKTLSSTNESGDISYSTYVARKKGNQDVDISSYLAPMTTPVPVGYQVLDTTNYPINFAFGVVGFNNGVLSTNKVPGGPPFVYPRDRPIPSHQAIYQYEGVVSLPLPIPLIGTNSVALTGLLQGSAVDYTTYSVKPSHVDVSYFTIPKTLTLSRMVGTTTGTNGETITVVGSIIFGISKPVANAKPNIAPKSVLPDLVPAADAQADPPPVF